jgi:hypothetical protein
MAMALLAGCDLCKFHLMRKGINANFKVGWCRNDSHFLLHAGIVRICDLTAEDKASAKRDRKPKSTLSSGYWEESQRAFQRFDRAPAQDASAITYRILNVPTHGNR